ncbi:RICIN domain-containing protein [Streptomyces sp. NPDC087901]|uniref:RICIN domain-containing protein n=1 Tax=Streptomyces sp. NPDC087901 TaxID=3365818 RepID=UPI00381EC7C1
MNKISHVLTGAAALGALVAGIPTSYAVDFPTTTNTIENHHTGTCLGESGKQVRMYDCDGGASVTWQIRETANASGSMIRNSTSTSCLDNDGANVYLSDCNTSDLGQRWFVWGCPSHIVSRLAYERDPNSAYLTGWNAGTVSVSNNNSLKSEWISSGWGCESAGHVTLPG